MLYEYKAIYLSNYDGDTIRFSVDLGFNIWHTIIVRLLNIDTWEIKDKEHKELAILARNKVGKLLKEADGIMINTYKDSTDKYGRFLADVFFQKDKRTINLSEYIRNNLKEIIKIK